MADDTQLRNWMLFLKARTEEEFEAVAQTNPAINEAWEILKGLSADPRFRTLAEASNELGIILDLWYGQPDKQKEGVNIIAKDLLRKKFSYEEISSVTYLPIKEVQKLDAEVQKSDADPTS